MLTPSLDVGGKTVAGEAIIASIRRVNIPREAHPGNRRGEGLRGDEKTPILVPHNLWKTLWKPCSPSNTRPME